MEKEIARQRAISNAMAVNNVLTVAYLEELSDEQLLCFVHPLERVELAKVLLSKEPSDAE